MRFRGYNVGTLAKTVVKESLEDNVLGLAAQTAYYFFFSLFPLLLFLTPLFSLVDDKQRFMDFLMNQFGRALPPESFQLFRDIVASVVYSDAAPGLMSVGAILALWTGSNVFNSLIGALNRAYDVEETRPWWKTRLVAIGMVLLSGGVIILATITLVAGQQIVGWLTRLVGLDTGTASALLIVQYAAALLLLLGVGFLTYIILPCVRQSRMQTLAGAILATVLWVLVTLAFRYYAVNFADYNKTYGTIGGVIVLLTWMYLSMVVLLIGGELNSELHKGTGRLSNRGGTLLGGRISSGDVPLPSVERVVEVR
ncbi:MAG: YihY/virulence factor BrkB family protein [Gemmatimonadaceae bacterium]